MKISEIIMGLQTFLRDHGDIVCVAETGMDPSDLEPVKKLYLTEHEGKPAVEIYAEY
jgi:hypothetical protein